MKPSDGVCCAKFPCTDVRHDGFVVPSIEVASEQVSIVLISEAAPPSLADYYYSGGEALFAQTTVQAFRDAGAQVSSVADIMSLGVYLTTAVKCGKTGYGIETATVKECSLILERELALFPNAKVYLLMGDVAIRAINYTAQGMGEPRVIPAGSTYKIRGGEFWFAGRRVFPSYLQAGPSFFIEKSKRRMIAEDIAEKNQRAKVEEIEGSIHIVMFAIAYEGEITETEIDLVLNHCAAEHEWAERARAGEAEYEELFWIFPNRRMPNRYEATLPEVFPDFAPGNFTYYPDEVRFRVSTTGPAPVPVPIITPNTTAAAQRGAFIPCTIMHTLCPMPSKVLRIRFVRWSSKIIARFMTGEPRFLSITK